MVSSDGAAIPLGTSPHSSKPAFLVKFPQDVWERIIAAGSGGLKISHDDAKLSLVLPDRTIAMDTQPLNSTEIYELSDSLQPLGTASSRLSVPFSTASSSKAPEASRSAADKQPKHRASAISGPAAKVRQQATVPLARSQSSPGGSGSGTAAASTPVVPLKTRVVQHLALGPASVEEIVAKVGGVETDVMRVVKVVGRQVGEHPPRYSLQPSQYTKIKIVGWRYSPEEQKRVGELAKEAFDELEIPPDADERVELDRKLAEAAAAPPSPEAGAPPTIPAPAPAQVSLRPVQTISAVPFAPPAPTISPPPVDQPANGSSSAAQPSSSKSRSSSATKKGVVAREMAKFRAEQARSTSAPAPKGGNGVASPRAATATLSSAPEGSGKATKKRSGATEKAGRSDTSDSRSDEREGKGKVEKKRRRERKSSPDFTSSEDEEEDEGTRGRVKQRPSASKPSTSHVSGTNAKPPPDPVTSKRSPLSFTKRKSPPEPLQLKHQSQSATPSTTTSERPDDPEELRDRYEELYPAYQQLTTKLIALHRAAEGMETGESDGDLLPTKAEMEKMVGKWEKWHNELTGIRRWFGSGPV